MKCPECGIILEEGMRFCPECGAPVSEKSSKKNPKPKGSSSGKRTIVLSSVLAGSILISGGAVAADVILQRNSAAHSAEQGQSFLEGENYEQAVYCFNKALETNNANAEAYLGKAQALDAMGMTEDAVEVLELGISKCSDNRLTALCAALSEKPEPQTPAEVPKTEETTTEEAAAEETAAEAVPSESVEVTAQPEPESAEAENIPTEAEEEPFYKDFVREETGYYPFYTIKYEGFEEGRSIGGSTITEYNVSNEGIGTWTDYKSKDGTTDNMYEYSSHTQGTYSVVYYYDEAADKVYTRGATGSGYAMYDWINNSDGTVSFYWMYDTAFLKRFIIINEYDGNRHLTGYKSYSLEEAQDNQISRAENGGNVKHYVSEQGYDVSMGYLDGSTGIIGFDGMWYVFDTDEDGAKYECEFDKDNNCIAERTYSNYLLSLSIEREYNSGKLVCEEEVKYSDSGKVTAVTRTKYGYDNNGGQIRKVKYYITGDWWRITTEYRDGVKDIRYVSEYRNGLLKEYTQGEYLYGFILSETHYSSFAYSEEDSQMQSILEDVSPDNILLEANDEGLLAGVRITDGAGSILCEHTGEWYRNPDSDGEKVMFITGNGDKVLSVFYSGMPWSKYYSGEYEYDENGNPVSGTVYVKDSYYERETEYSTLSASYVRTKDVFKD